jgi:hypothetical protein
MEHEKDRPMTGKKCLQGPRKYRLKIKGRLEVPWSDWFDGKSLVHEEGVSILEVEVEDQAKLHGILNRIRDLNLILISLEAMDQKQ